MLSRGNLWFAAAAGGIAGGHGFGAAGEVDAVFLVGQAGTGGAVENVGIDISDVAFRFCLGRIRVDTGISFGGEGKGLPVAVAEHGALQIGAVYRNIRIPKAGEGFMMGVAVGIVRFAGNHRVGGGNSAQEGIGSFF